MTNPLALYSSKKLRNYLGKNFFSTHQEISPTDKPNFFHWYGDVFFYQRKKFLIFTNELTRFTFAIGPYTVNNKLDFMDLFKSQLKISLSLFQLDSELYLSRCSTTGLIAKSHPGATAHLNVTKGDFLYSLAYGGNILSTEDVALEFTWRVNDQPVTKKGIKTYIYPAVEFKNYLDQLQKVN
jgi:hypothetical protein